MHSRYRRPMELQRDAPRRVINLFQNSPANGDIDTVSGPLMPANQVCTGMAYGHASAGGGNDWVNLGLNNAKLTGVQATQPFLNHQYAPPYSNRWREGAWLNHDKNLSMCSGPMQTPLGNGPAYPVHVWRGSSFAGSCSVVQLRNQLPGEVLPPGQTRTPTPPPGYVEPSPGTTGGSTPTVPRSGWPVAPVAPRQVILRTGGGGGGMHVANFRGRITGAMG